MGFLVREQPTSSRAECKKNLSQNEALLPVALGEYQLKEAGRLGGGR